MTNLNQAFLIQKLVEKLEIAKAMRDELIENQDCQLDIRLKGTFYVGSDPYNTPISRITEIAELNQSLGIAINHLVIKQIDNAIEELENDINRNAANLLSDINGGTESDEAKNKRQAPKLSQPAW